MQEYIAFDSHKHYTLAEREDVASGRARQTRIDHAPGAIRAYLAGCAPGTPVALEAMGSWYWIVEEIEQAGLRPLLVHARKAKLMMGQTNKTDRLDVHGLNRLQRTGTLPTVWVPPSGVRDLRELTRARIALVHWRTDVKNHIHSMLAKHGLAVGASDAFGRKGRAEIDGLLDRLPDEAGGVTRMLLAEVDTLSGHVAALERRLKALIVATPAMQRLMTLPGVGVVLAATVALEIGDVTRFRSAPRLAAYAGTTPRVSASGGKTHYGPLRADANRTLQWALAEAANSVAVNHTRKPERHVSALYRRLRERKGHGKAIGAVARHLAEAAWHVLTKDEPYRDPNERRGRTTAA